MGGGGGEHVEIACSRTDSWDVLSQHVDSHQRNVQSLHVDPHQWNVQSEHVDSVC